MAKTSKADIKELTNEELEQKIIDDKLRFQKLRFNHKVTQLDNPVELRYARREIARFMTELRKREIAEQQSASNE